MQSAAPLTIPVCVCCVLCIVCCVCVCVYVCVRGRERETECGRVSKEEEYVCARARVSLFVRMCLRMYVVCVCP